MKLRLFQALGELFATAAKAKVSNSYETPNLSANATVVTVQNAIRSAEAGDTRSLFALYRDLTIGGSHVQAEFNKRKLAVLAQPHAILPADKTRPEDVTAALAVTTMIADADNWNDGLTHLLDSTLWPVTAAEKLFRARNLPGDMPTAVPLRFTLRKIEPVNPTLLCFQKPVGSAARNLNLNPNLNPAEPTLDTWESDLRFFATDGEGRVNYSYADSYPVDPVRHLIHRGHLLAGVRDNWGGPMRSIVFWWLLSVLGRDWFARAMERFGVPFPVGRTNAKDREAVEFLSTAFSLSSKIGGLVVDHDTQIELKEVAISGLADAHEKFIGICNREISKVIVGQTLSAEAQPTGLGSGTANLQGDVRNDIRMFDCIKLGEALQKQLFAPFLQINGLRGAPPKIVWGGLGDEDAQGFASLLNVLSQAGFEPTDEAIPTMNERLGFPIQRKVAAPPAQFGGASFGGFGGGPRKQIEAEDEEEVKKLSAPMRARLITFQAQGRMAEALGVPAGWLNPVRDFLEELQTKAADATLSEQDLLDFLDRAVARVPELFAAMDIDALASVLEAGLGNAVLGSVRQGLRTREALGAPRPARLIALRGEPFAAPAAAPIAPPPATVNLNLNPPAVRPKSVRFERDEHGRITGATVTETGIVDLHEPA